MARVLIWTFVVMNKWAGGTYSLAVTDNGARGGTLVITTAQTLTAKAFKAGMPDSNSDFPVIKIDMQQPSISPAIGTYTSGRTVSITTPSPGASIYYTLDNTDPPPSSPVFAPGRRPSAITAGAYVITP